MINIVILLSVLDVCCLIVWDAESFGSDVLILKRHFLVRKHDCKQCVQVEYLILHDVLVSGHVFQ